MTNKRKLSDAEKVAWIQLCLSENVGAITFHGLINAYRTASSALARLPGLAARGGLKRPIKIYPRAKAERELELASAKGVHLIASNEAEYPPLLAETADAPPLLWGIGNTALLQRTCIAMVGSRVASANGMFFARQIASSLGQHKLTVVSGLAVGIDTESHIGSLEQGTVAVLVGGVDVIYPQENRDLYQEIAEKGMLIAIHPLGQRIHPHYFLKRNYTVAGMSLVTVVVECRLRSGSLSAAKAAIDYGREVFAVPGSPFDPRSRGCNKLIRENAVMIETVDDVLHELGLIQPPVQASRPAALPKDDIAVSDLLVTRYRDLVREKVGAAPVSVDFLARELEILPNVIRIILLELELAGKIERLRGDLVCLRNDSEAI